ncbi:hypothetical protein D3C87_1801420 [compost metagenome]
MCREHSIWDDELLQRISWLGRQTPLQSFLNESAPPHREFVAESTSEERPSLYSTKNDKVPFVSERGLFLEPPSCAFL